MKIQSCNIQVLRRGELIKQLQLWKRFGILYLVLFVTCIGHFNHVAVGSEVKYLIDGSDSWNVISGSTRKRKRSDQDEIDSGYAPIGSQRNMRRLNQEEVGGKAIFDDVP
ncbi:hypothetical protein Tco_0688244 [Tanacetum coccineum]